MGEVSWEDEGDVKEIIADVRDAECEMRWYAFLCLPVACKRDGILDHLLRLKQR